MRINILIIFCFAFGFLYSQEVDVAYADSLQMESRKQFKRENPKPTFKTLEILKAYSLKHNYQKGLFNVANYKGIFHNFLGNLDSTRVYYKEALVIGEKHKFYKGLYKVQSNLGVLEDYLDNYNEAIKWYLESIKLSEQLQDSIQTGKNYGNLATVYSRINDIELQEYYIKKGIGILPENTYDKGVLYTDLTDLNLDTNNYVVALDALKKAERINAIIKNDKLLFYINRLYGHYYMRNSKYKTALGYFKKAIAYQTFSYYYEIEIQANIGRCNLKLNNYKEAEFYLNKAHESSKKFKTPFDLKESILKHLASLKHLKTPSESYDLLLETLDLKDSTYISEKIELSKKLSVEFETEKKDKELAENALEIEKKKNQLLSILSIAAFLLVLSLVLFLVYRLSKQKHKVNIVNLEKENELAKLEALLKGEDKERSRIAKELHDGINGDLSAIKIQLSSLPTNKSYTKKETMVFNQSIDMIDNTCQVIRNISHNLAPPAIKDFGWLEAVERFCRKMDANYKEQIAFQSYGDDLQFNESSQANLYRIVQEMVYNVIKHAKATEVLVQATINGNSLSLIVEDNGIGYNQTKKSEGIGLRNIASRIEYLGGYWEVESNAKGTTHNVTFNLKALLK